MIKDIKLIISVVKDTMNDPEVVMALAAYRNNVKHIKALYKRAINDEREVFGKIAVKRAKAIYFSKKLARGDFETVLD